MVTNTSGLALGLKLGANSPTNDGVCKITCNKGWDWLGLLRMNSYMITKHYLTLDVILYYSHYNTCTYNMITNLLNALSNL